MNNTEALDVLRSELARWRQMSWPNLRAHIKRSQASGWPKKEEHAETVVVAGASGTQYQVQIQVFWDGRPDEVVRVVGSVDDGGLRAFVPMTEDFLVRPDGTFVSEA